MVGPDAIGIQHLAGGTQQLMKIVKTKDGCYVQTMGPCYFVMLIGAGAWDDRWECSPFPDILAIMCVSHARW